MNFKKLGLATAITGLFAAGIVLAADHIDAPAVTGKSTDITDMYVFQGQNTNNMVFVANTQGLLTPSATGTAAFDDGTMLEFNIDNNADNVEDLVIQCLFNAGKMYVVGPVKPATTGTTSTVNAASSVIVDVTPYGSSAIIANANSVSAFAGPRDDPFYFDLDQYKKILGGQASGFNNPGTDTFKGTNVLSAVVEVPKAMLGATNNKINVWLETKKRN